MSGVTGKSLKLKCFMVMENSIFVLKQQDYSAGTLALLLHIRRHVFLSYNAFDFKFYNYFSY